MLRQELINQDGRKYTLMEFFKEFTEGLFEICSIKNGHLITGTKEQIQAGLRSHLFGSCVQYIEVDEYGTTVYLR